MLFAYKAVKKDGTHYDGTIEAEDKFAVYKNLHAGGDIVLEVREKGAKGLFTKLSNVSFGGTKTSDKIMFAKNLSAMLRAGLPLARALSVLERQMSSRSWAPIFKKLGDNLAQGVTFSQSLGQFPRVFPPLFVSMVAAGEESGSLSESLGIVGEQLEKSYELRKKIRGAMMYPAIILLVMLAITVLMLVFVLPKLVVTFRDFNTELPLATRTIISASEFFTAYYAIIIAVAALILAGLWSFSKTYIGKKVLGQVAIKMPIIGTIVQEVNSARTARTLSSLLSSGVDVVASIRITSDVVQNVHYREMLLATSDKIQKGTSLESIFTENMDLYPSFVGEMIGVGEETGTLSKTLQEVAIFYENEVSQKTKDMSTVIEPFLMVVIGVGVGFFAIAMISPIYSLSTSI